MHLSERITAEPSPAVSEMYPDRWNRKSEHDCHPGGHAHPRADPGHHGPVVVALVCPHLDVQAHEKGIAHAQRVRHAHELRALDAPVATLAYRGGERLDEVRPKWEVIGTHAARRTFVVNALRLGVPPTVVMQWTGHSGYDAMRPYIAVADRTRAHAMTRFDELGEDEMCN